MNEKATASNLKAMETLVNIVDQMVSNRIRMNSGGQAVPENSREQKKAAFLLAHPVGTIYTSVGNNPQSIYGGVWVLLNSESAALTEEDGSTRQLRIKRWLRTS